MSSISYTSPLCQVCYKEISEKENAPNDICSQKCMQIFINTQFQPIDSEAQIKRCKSEPKKNRVNKGKPKNLSPSIFNKLGRDSPIYNKSNK